MKLTCIITMASPQPSEDTTSAQGQPEHPSPQQPQGHPASLEQATGPKDSSLLSQPAQHPSSRLSLCSPVTTHGAAFTSPPAPQPAQTVPGLCGTPAPHGWLASSAPVGTTELQPKARLETCRANGKLLHSEFFKPHSHPSKPWKPWKPREAQGCKQMLNCLHPSPTRGSWLVFTQSHPLLFLLQPEPGLRKPS